MAQGGKTEIVEVKATQPVVERNTTTSSTTSTMIVPTNPLLDPRNITEAGGLIILLTGVWALVEKRSEKKRKEDQASHKPEHDAIAKELTDLKHDLKNNEQTINAVAAHRTSDVERIVKLEMRQENIEKGQLRIEAAMEKNHKDTMEQMRTMFGEVCDSVREVRDVKPK